MEDQSGSSACTAPPEVSSYRSSVTAQNSSIAVVPSVNDSTVGTVNINVQTCGHSAEHMPAEDSQTACDISLSISKELKSNLNTKFQMIFEGIPIRGKQTSLNEIYTKLYITEGERKGLNEEHEIWQTDPALKTPTEQDKLISYNDIFKPLNNQGNKQTEEEKTKAEQTLPRTVLTKGIAGIGKTVSVRKFILDWAEEEANQDIDLLFVLPFRELNSVKNKKQSLHELLLDFHSELKEFKDPKCYDDCKILFVFDGLDESQLPLDFGQRRVSDVSEAASLDVLMTNLIKGNLLPKALVWITSRPAAIDKIPNNLIHRMTEVRGFTDEQKQEYFRKKISDKIMAERIISHVKRSRTLEIMCHIPIFCWITATVLEHILKTGQKKIPSSLTELYTRFLLTQTSVKRKKYTGDTGRNLLKLSDAGVQLILKLGKLAFENLQEKNIVFSEDDLKKYEVDVTEASLRSGVFTEIIKEEDPMFSVKKYSFVHLSFQEYLAAVYVVHTYANTGENEIQSIQKNHPTDFFKHPGKHIRADEWDGDEDDDDEDCVIPHKVPRQEINMYDLHKCAIDMALKSKSGHLDLFLRFLLGLSLESALKWLCESGIPVNVKPGQKITEETIKYLKSNLREEYDRKIPSSERCINLFHCLLELNDHSIEEEIRRFSTSDKQAEQRLTAGQCSALAYIILMSGEILEELDLKKYNTSDEGRRRLVPVVKTCRKALLSHCSLSDKCLESVASALQNPKGLLKQLSLIQNFLDDRSLTLLCAGLGSPHCRLETLNLCDADLEERGEDLSRAVLMSPLIQLHTLKLFACNLKDPSAEILGSTLSSSKCRLRELDLSYNNLTNNGVKFILQGLLSPNSRVEILRLAGNMIDEDCCTDLASVLERSFLKELILDRSNVGDVGVEYLCKGLMSPDCKLEILGLRDCNLSEKACSYLTEVLSSYSVLRDLNLEDNDLQDSGVELLSTGLKHPKCILQNLGLSGCMITEQGCAALTSALESNPSHLRELDLSYNHPGTSGEELLKARLEDPQCKLETLRLDHAGPSRITAGLWKYYQADEQEDLTWSSDKSRDGVQEFRYYETDHKDKEGIWPRVCSIEKLIGERFYWELKCTEYFSMGVSNRKVYMCISAGVYEVGCTEHKHRYQRYTKSISAITKPERIGVLLDWPAGTMGLYGISSQGVSHLHTFHTKFDKHRYPAEDIGHRLLHVRINTTQSPEFSFSATFKITEPV